MNGEDLSTCVPCRDRCNHLCPLSWQLLNLSCEPQTCYCQAALPRAHPTVLPCAEVITFKTYTIKQDQNQLLFKTSNFLKGKQVRLRLQGLLPVFTFKTNIAGRLGRDLPAVSPPHLCSSFRLGAKKTDRGTSASCAAGLKTGR